MSGDENQPPGSAFSPTERGKARRFLLGIPTFFLALTLFSLDSWVPVARPLRLPFHILPLALFIAGVILQWSRPQGAEQVLIPHNLRRVARLAGVPEVGVMIMLYGSVIVGMTFAAAALIVTIGSTTP
jgi:hypothetical protein